MSGTTTWYKLSTYDDRIDELTVEKRTKSYIFVRSEWGGRQVVTREQITNRHFETKAEAEAYAIQRAELNVAALERRLDDARKRLANLTEGGAR